MADTAGVLIERGEKYDILRNAQHNWDQVKTLLDGISTRENVPTGVILTECRDEDGSNALHYAAMAGNREMAHRLLGEVDGTVPDLKSMFLNEKNKAGNTALHWACRKGSEAFAKALVLWNPNYTIRNNEGETAIDLAWLNMHDAIVEYLRSPCRQAGVSPMPPMPPTQTGQSAASTSNSLDRKSRAELFKNGYQKKKSSSDTEASDKK